MKEYLCCVYLREHIPFLQRLISHQPKPPSFSATKLNILFASATILSPLHLHLLSLHRLLHIHMTATWTRHCLSIPHVLSQIILHYSSPNQDRSATPVPDIYDGDSWGMAVKVLSLQIFQKPLSLLCCRWYRGLYSTSYKPHQDLHPPPFLSSRPMTIVKSQQNSARGMPLI